jgi:hypothetical protein
MTNEAKQTEADVIWGEIKDLPIDMFSLPNQKVSGYVKRMNVPGDQLLITLNVSSVLPALETAIDKRGLEIEQTEKYTIVRRAKVVDASSVVEDNNNDSPVAVNKRAAALVKASKVSKSK